MGEETIREILGENFYAPLLSIESEAFLSAEDASQEQSSIDDLPLQVQPSAKSSPRKQGKTRKAPSLSPTSSRTEPDHKNKRGRLSSLPSETPQPTTKKSPIKADRAAPLSSHPTSTLTSPSSPIEHLSRVQIMKNPTKTRTVPP